MAQYRTAQGKIVDMSSLVARNERARAVGNMKANARGDIIDGQGRVIESVNNRVSKRYNKTVGNRSAMPINTRPNQAMADPIPTPNPSATPSTPSIDQNLQSLEQDFNDDDALEMEKIKEQENKQKGKKK